MKYYQFSFRQKNAKLTVVLKAHSKEEAIKKFKQSHKGTLIRVKEVAAPADEMIKELIQKFINNFTGKKVSLKQLIVAIRQMSVMTNAGISVHDSLKEIVKATEDKKLKEILQQAVDNINAGLNLSDTFKQYKNELGGITLAMVELGERTGNMADSLGSLADILEEVQENIAKFKKAMRYPLITLTAMAAAFTILITVVVPKFKAIFESFHAELPLPTKILLGLEYALSNYGLLILMGLIGIIAAVIYFYRTNEKFKYNTDKLLLKVYLIKDIIYFATLQRFSLVFTELIHSGIPVAEALDTATDMIDNAVLKERLEGVKISVSRGVTLTDAFRDTDLFESMIIQMISAGETSGQLDAMMNKVTDYYRMRFNNILDNMSAYIEPIMLAFLAAMVLLLALGIFMPMWDLARAVKGAP